MGQILPSILARGRLSPKLWHKIPVREIMLDPTAGWGFYRDFSNAPNFATNATTQQDGWAAFLSNGPTIKGIASLGGVLRATGLNSDNDEAYLQAGGNSGSAFNCVSGGGALGFEARIRKSTVANDAMAVFLGLAETALVATATLAANTGVMKDSNYLGFAVIAADGNGLTFTWKADGVTAVTPITLQDILADTWYSLGFLFDPQAEASKRITIFINGEPFTTYVTETSMDLTSFPDDITLTPSWFNKVGTASLGSATSDLAWIACFQESQS